MIHSNGIQPDSREDAGDDQWAQIAEIHLPGFHIGLRVREVIRLGQSTGHEYRCWDIANARWACGTSIEVRHSETISEEFDRASVAEHGVFHRPVPHNSPLNRAFDIRAAYGRISLPS